MEEIQLDSRYSRSNQNEFLNCGSFPKYVEFQINSRCNANCTICPYEEMAKKYPAMIMPDEGIEKIISECDTHKSEIIRMIPYLNSEPTLDKRFIDVLRRIKSGGHFVEVSTNMSGMTKEKMEAIVKERLIDDFKISFFGGTEELYKQLMPNLNFYKVVSLIKSFLEINQANGNSIDVEIIVVLGPWIDMEENMNHIRHLFPNVRIHPYGFLDRAGSVKGHSNSKRLQDEESFRTHSLAGCKLKRPFERTVIMANGDVILCSQDWDREEIVGNVFETSIKEVWNGVVFQKARQRVMGQLETPDSYICKRCKLALLSSKESGEEKVKMNFIGDRYLTDKDEKLIK